MRRLPLVSLLLAAVLLLAACGGDSKSEVSTSDLDGRAFVGVGVTGHANDIATVVAPAKIGFTFDGDRLSVATGCNGISGTYTLHGAIMRLPDPVSTMMGCEPALEAQQKWVTDLLNNGLATGLSGDRMTLTSHGSTLALKERPTP